MNDEEIKLLREKIEIQEKIINTQEEIISSYKIMDDKNQFVIQELKNMLGLKGREERIKEIHKAVERYKN